MRDLFAGARVGATGESGAIGAAVATAGWSGRRGAERCGEGVGEGSAGGEAVGGVLGHRRCEDGVDCGRQVRRAPAGSGDRLQDVGHADRHRVAGGERRSSGEERVRRRGQRVLVGARIGGVTLEQFGSGVGDGADGQPRVVGGAG